MRLGGSRGLAGRAVAGLALGVLAVGTVPVGPANAVVNGSPVRDGQLDFAVSLIDREDLAGKAPYDAQFCGGALTSPTTVVTAAHCLISPTTMRPIDPASIVIGIGTNLASPSLRTVAVSSYALHPRYRTQESRYDVAVVTLAAPVDGVTPIGVQRSTDPALRAGSPALVAGWGNTQASSASYPTTLMVGAVSVFPQRSCGAGDPFAVGEVIFDGYSRNEANAATMVCAAGVTPAKAIVDACQGDSGSPLVSVDASGRPLRLIGVVSWGQDCATLHPGVYTRLSAFTSFLDMNGAFGPPVVPAFSLQSLDSGARVSFAAPASGGRPALLVATATRADGTLVQCATRPSRTVVPATCALAGLANGEPVPVTAVAQGAAGVSAASDPLLVTPAPLPSPGSIVRGTVRGTTATVTVSGTSVIDGGTTGTLMRTVRCTSADGSPDLRAAVRQTSGTALLRGVRPTSYSCVIEASTPLGVTQSAPRLLAGTR